MTAAVDGEEEERLPRAMQLMATMIIWASNKDRKEGDAAVGSRK